MPMAPGTTGTGDTTDGVRPIPASEPAARPARTWWWGLAVLIGLTAAGQVGLIVVVSNRLRGASSGARAHGRATASEGVQGQAARVPAVHGDVATEVRSPVPVPASRRDNPLAAAAGPAEAPQPAEGAAGPAPAASTIPHARPGPDRPAAVAADPPGRDDPSLGRELFARRWIPDDPRCHGGDGLGPVYNATSCADCHNQGGPGGGGPLDRNVELAAGIGYMVFVGDPTVVVDSRGNGWGSQFDQSADRADLAKVHPAFRDAGSVVLHRFGVDPDYEKWRSTLLSRCRTTPPVTTRHSGGRHGTSRGHAPASHVPRLARTRAALDRQVQATVRDIENGLGSERVAFRVTRRNTPPLFGAGLIDGLSESDLLNAAQGQPEETRGRVHRLKDGRLGRFGWKSQVASLEDFVLTACANEMGLEVPGHRQAVSPTAPEARAQALDLTAEECAALVAYVRKLPRPVSLDSSDGTAASAVVEGRKLFHSIGCASCHTADLGSIPGIYSDLLLHEMGMELSDSGAYYGDGSDSVGSVTSSEWRTPPLWGFRDTAPYLHDGRARNLKEAVVLHRGQGETSANRFQMLSDPDQARVEAFLNSLVSPGASSPLHPAGGAAGHRPDRPGAGPAAPQGRGADRQGSMLGRS